MGMVGMVGGHGAVAWLEQYVCGRDDDAKEAAVRLAATLIELKELELRV